MEKEFMKNNQKAILEEMGATLNEISVVMNEIAGMSPMEKPRYESAILRSALIAMGQGFGYIVALYNQYMVFETGEVGQKAKPIGFAALNNGCKEKKEGDGK